VQDADYSGVCGDNAKPNRCDHGSEQNEGHNQGIHGNQPLTKGFYQMRGLEIRIPCFFCFSSADLQSNRVDAPRC
jgi:hypothetical protein